MENTQNVYQQMYSHAVLQQLKCKELDVSTPGVEWRRCCVQFFSTLCNELNQAVDVIFVSCYYTDRVYSSGQFNDNNWIQNKKILATIFLIAAKLECRGLHKVVYESLKVASDCQTFSVDELQTIELQILEVLKFECLSPPTDIFFFELLLLTEGKVVKSIKDFIKLVLVMSLFDVDLRKRYLPSDIASAAIILANYQFDKALWSENMYNMTGENINSFRELVKKLDKIMQQRQDPMFKAISDLFYTTQYSCIASNDYEPFF